mgnify:CR=1 FL=1
MQSGSATGSELRKDAPESQAMKRAAEKELRQLLALLERELGESNFSCGQISLADLAAICYVPGTKAMGVNADEFKRLQAWIERMRGIPAVAADHERTRKAMHEVRSIADEFEGPDGRIHWRDSRLEWPVQHGFTDLAAREFHAGKMMFPPDAS